MNLKKSLNRLFCLLLTSRAAALESLVAHIDIDGKYLTDTQMWQWTLIANGIVKQPEQCFMPGRDLPAGISSNRTGERHTRPASAAWDFLGVDAGQNVWIYTQLNNQYAWLGFHDTQSLFTLPQQVKLVGVDGPAGGHFSLYNSSSAFFFKTTDGINESDLYEKPLSHNHINWAFSKKGIWRVRLKVAGYLGPSATNATPVSQEIPLYFAIGHRAQWRATYYNHSNVMNDQVAGELADADGDGLVNLLEYAFGGNPQDAGAQGAEHGGLLRPTVRFVNDSDMRFLEIRYYRRLDEQPVEVVYEPQFSSSLEENSWSVQGANEVVTPVNAHWESVTVRDAVAISTSGKRFARVKVTAVE